MSSPSSALETPLSNEFVIPINKDIQATLRPDGDNNSTYLCGNSLGLLSKRANTLIQEEVNAWGTHSVVAHFRHPLGRAWSLYTDAVNKLMAEVVGAKEEEVAVMGGLTNNLHLMMDSFYNPTPDRYKILCEAKAFPSDQYAFASQVVAHGLDPATAILEVSPREGEYVLREEDILETIEKEGSSIALVLFSGVQYYTGQVFPMKEITRKAKAKGCVCGWDLAHAVGNIPLSLHDWDADFAVWCTYKYLNSGPGGIAGLFIHEKWNETQRPKFAGWWGHQMSTRFAMPPTFSPIVGAQGFQQSNPSILATAGLWASLQIFKEVGMMASVRERSLLLTGALEKLLMKSKRFVPLNDVAQRYPQSGAKNTELGFTIITPSDPAKRGAQLSLLFLPAGSDTMEKMFAALIAYGVIGDEREPDVIRLAPAPLYNTIKDCEQAAFYLEEAFKTLAK